MFLNSSIRFGSLTVLLSVLLVQGCNNIPISDPNKSMATQDDDKRSMSQIMNDASITAAITAKYVKDDQIKVFDIQVSTFNGIVMLEGVLPSLAVEDQAILLATQANGVKKIISNIKIVPQSQ